MRRGPERQKVDFAAKADAAWSPAPDWIRTLAAACNDRGQPAVAKSISYSAATVSQVISNTYGGDLGKIEAMVRGALMSETVPCPMQGPMRRNVCIGWQDKPFAPTSADRVRMYHACRNGCPFSKHTKTRAQEAEHAS